MPIASKWVLVLSAKSIGFRYLKNVVEEHALFPATLTGFFLNDCYQWLSKKSRVGCVVAINFVYECAQQANHAEKPAGLSVLNLQRFHLAPLLSFIFPFAFITGLHKYRWRVIYLDHISTNLNEYPIIVCL